MNGLIRHWNEKLLFAGEVYRLRAEDSGARDLGSNQECRHHGRYTDEAQELID